MQHCLNKNILRNVFQKENDLFSHFKWKNIERNSLKLKNYIIQQNMLIEQQLVEDQVHKERRLKEMLSVNSSILIPAKKEIDIQKMATNYISSPYQYENILKDTFG